VSRRNADLAERVYLRDSGRAPKTYLSDLLTLQFDDTKKKAG
jgi:hypothetical protein